MKKLALVSLIVLGCTKPNYDSYIETVEEQEVVINNQQLEIKELKERITQLSLEVQALIVGNGFLQVENDNLMSQIIVLQETIVSLENLLTENTTMSEEEFARLQGIISELEATIVHMIENPTIIIETVTETVTVIEYVTETQYITNTVTVEVPVEVTVEVPSTGTSTVNVSSQCSCTVVRFPTLAYFLLSYYISFDFLSFEL